MKIRLYLHNYRVTEPALQDLNGTTLKPFWLDVSGQTPAQQAKEVLSACRYGRKQVREGQCKSFHVITGDHKKITENTPIFAIVGE